MKNLHLKPIRNVAAARAARLGAQICFPFYRDSLLRTKRRRALIEARISALIKNSPAKQSKTGPNAHA